jgi:signal peptidase I
MIEEKIVDKINKFLTKELILNMGDVVIFKNENNTYELFNQYIIQPHINNGYKIVCKFNSIEKTFSSVKNAVAWCVFDRNQKINECSRIQEIDILLDSIDVKIILCKRYLKRQKNLDSKLLYLNKLKENQDKKKRLNGELDEFIKLSKYWQDKKFIRKD